MFRGQQPGKTLPKKQVIVEQDEPYSAAVRVLRDKRSEPGVPDSRFENSMHSMVRRIGQSAKTFDRKIELHVRQDRELIAR